MAKLDHLIAAASLEHVPHTHENARGHLCLSSVNLTGQCDTTQPVVADTCYKTCIANKYAVTQAAASMISLKLLCPAAFVLNLFVVYT